MQEDGLGGGGGGGGYGAPKPQAPKKPSYGGGGGGGKGGGFLDGIKSHFAGKFGGGKGKPSGGYGAPAAPAKPSYGAQDDGGLLGGFDFGEILKKKFGVIKSVINPVISFKRNKVNMIKTIFEKKMKMMNSIGKGMTRMMKKGIKDIKASIQGIGGGGNNGGGYGAPPPNDGGYGAPAPNDGYGAPAPADDGYGAPAPADDGYGAPAPADDGYGAPAPGGYDAAPAAPAPGGYGGPIENAAPAPGGYGGPVGGGGLAPPTAPETHSGGFAPLAPPPPAPGGNFGNAGASEGVASVIEVRDNEDSYGSPAAEVIGVAPRAPAPTESPDEYGAPGAAPIGGGAAAPAAGGYDAAPAAPAPEAYAAAPLAPAPTQAPDNYGSSNFKRAVKHQRNPFLRRRRKIKKRKTKIQMVPLTLGLKYILPTKCLSPYLGAGLLVSYVDIRNHSPYVRKKDSKWGVGGICKLGCLADISQSFFIDVFCDYSYLKVTFGDHHQKVLRHKTDLSGLSFGGGLGYRF